MKIDLVKCTLDYESLEDIPEDKVFTNFRYGYVSMALGVVAKIVYRAKGYKKCCCGNPYIMAAMREFIKGETDIYTIEVDGEKVVENLVSNTVMVMNCKYAA